MHQINFLPGPSTIVKADYDKIGEVITNLISNAVKYSPANSTIDLFYRNVGGTVEVSVRDHGIGISEEDIPKLFERYYRIENQTPISGFGIGLYLCLEIINRHDGEIWVKSELGRGSVFTFIIPALL